MSAGSRQTTNDIGRDQYTTLKGILERNKRHENPRVSTAQMRWLIYLYWNCTKSGLGSHFMDSFSIDTTSSRFRGREYLNQNSLPRGYRYDKTRPKVKLKWWSKDQTRSERLKNITNLGNHRTGSVEVEDDSSRTLTSNGASTRFIRRMGDEAHGRQQTVQFPRNIWYLTVDSGWQIWVVIGQSPTENYLKSSCLRSALMAQRFDEGMKSLCQAV